MKQWHAEHDPSARARNRWRKRLRYRGISYDDVKPHLCDILQCGAHRASL